MKGFCNYNPTLAFDLRVCLFCHSAGQQQLFQRVTTGTVIPGVVHRPQVQQISNNIVTLSNVQSPALYSRQSNQTQPNHPNSQSLQTTSVPVMGNSNKKGYFLHVIFLALPYLQYNQLAVTKMYMYFHHTDQILVKRGLLPTQTDNVAKKVKLDLGKFVL